MKSVSYKIILSETLLIIADISEGTELFSTCKLCTGT